MAASITLMERATATLAIRMEGLLPFPFPERDSFRDKYMAVQLISDANLTKSIELAKTNIK